MKVEEGGNVGFVHRGVFGNVGRNVSYRMSTKTVNILFLHSSRCKAAELCQHAAIKLRRWGRLKEPITGKQVNRSSSVIG